MSMRFRTKELRDDLARRLSELAIHMIRSGDQGHDNTIAVSQDMIDDIRTAAYLVGMTEVLDDKIMRQHSETAWKIASLYSHVLASETRDLAAHIDVAIAAEREQCARIADAEEERHRKGGPVSSMAEDVWGTATAKEIAAAIRDPRNHGQSEDGKK